MVNQAPPFPIEALRPYVSVTLHEISHTDALRSVRHSRVAELQDALKHLFDAFDVHGENPFKLSVNSQDYAVIPKCEEDIQGLSFTGIWFKREAAPWWLDVNKGDPKVRDVTNHLLLVAIRGCYLAVLGTHEQSRDVLAAGLTQGFCGKRQLSFVAKHIDQEVLVKSFVRGKTRICWLTGLHSPIETKADRKTLCGRDLRYALDPFDDQTYTFTTVVSILPKMKHKRVPTYENLARTLEYAHYAFRVGVAPERRKVWTLQVKDFEHLREEIHILFDTLKLPKKGIGPSGTSQEGFKYLAKADNTMSIAAVSHAFDVGLDLPPPVEIDGEIMVTSERERTRELWRAHGQLEVAEAKKNSAELKIRIRYNEKELQILDLQPIQLSSGEIAFRPQGFQGNVHHEGLNCFETLFWEDSDVEMVIRYDSGHVIRGPRLYDLRWQDVLFDGWRWCFEPKRNGMEYAANMEKPARLNVHAQLPDRKQDEGWETNLDNLQSKPASLFEYLVHNVSDLLVDGKGDWFLCCDDGAGEVADFIFFEPDSSRLCLIHVKGANNDSANRGISAMAYEQVVGQATKNLRYLNRELLVKQLRIGQNKNYSIAKCCYKKGSNGALLNRIEFLEALEHYNHRLNDKRVIVFQPHIRKKAWDSAEVSWLNGNSPSPRNEINRFLQLRTLLATAEVLCRKVGVIFEVWGEK